MTENVEFIIELEGSDIIVTMPETIFMVAYRMREDVPELAANFVQDDEDGPISRAQFDKARELGWIV